MTTRNTAAKTNVAEGGLRYTAKAAGSMFETPTQGGAPVRTMSCFRCGLHKPISELATKKILGRNQRVCAASCRPKG